MSNMYQASINREDAIRVCLEWMKTHEENIEKKLEDAIKKRMETRRWFGFGRNFTRDEAIAYLKAPLGWGLSEWYWIEIHGSHWHDVCNEIISLCRSASVSDIVLKDKYLIFVTKLLDKEKENA